MRLRLSHSRVPGKPVRLARRNDGVRLFQFNKSYTCEAYSGRAYKFNGVDQYARIELPYQKTVLESGATVKTNGAEYKVTVDDATGTITPDNDVNANYKLLWSDTRLAVGDTVVVKFHAEGESDFAKLFCGSDLTGMALLSPSANIVHGENVFVLRVTKDTYHFEIRPDNVNGTASITVTDYEIAKADQDTPLHLYKYVLENDDYTYQKLTECTPFYYLGVENGAGNRFEALTYNNVIVTDTALTEWQLMRLRNNPERFIYRDNWKVKSDFIDVSIVKAWLPMCERDRAVLDYVSLDEGGANADVVQWVAQAGGPNSTNTWTGDHFEIHNQDTSDSGALRCIVELLKSDAYYRVDIVVDWTNGKLKLDKLKFRGEKSLRYQALATLGVEYFSFIGQGSLDDPAKIELIFDTSDPDYATFDANVYITTKKINRGCAPIFNYAYEMKQIWLNKGLQLIQWRRDVFHGMPLNYVDDSAYFDGRGYLKTPFVPPINPQPMSFELVFASPETRQNWYNKFFTLGASSIEGSTDILLRTKESFIARIYNVKMLSVKVGFLLPMLNHYMVNVTATQVRHFFQGAVVDSSGEPLALSATGELLLGVYGRGDQIYLRTRDNMLTGRIKFFKVYSRTFTDEEVSQRYNTLKQSGYLTGKAF